MRYRPIRTDGSNAWAAHTIKDRLPAILRQVIASNPGLTENAASALEALSHDLVGNRPLPELPPRAHDKSVWQCYLRDHAARIAPARPGWQNGEWFLIEHYFYRLILEAVDYFATGLDPFAVAKQTELSSPALAMRTGEVLSSMDPGERLLFALWGNQLDLSHTEALHHSGTRTDQSTSSPESSDSRPESAGPRPQSPGTKGQTTEDDHLIADDSAVTLDLLSRVEGPVHFICDNAGTEIVADLCLAEWLLRERGADVVLHVKAHPTFVSDATGADCEQTLEWFAKEPRPAAVREAGDVLARSAAGRSRGTGSLSFRPDLFWNSPLFMDALPSHLHGAFENAGLVIIKGDMNYRRQLHDTIVPASDPLTAWATPLPAPTLFLRTMKGDPVAGISADLLARLDREHPGWRTAGKHGLIQLLGG